MDNKEVEKVLEELENVRPEKLNDKAKRLFEAIMTIADGRDKAESDLYEANKRIADLLLILGDRDRMINEMAKYIDDFQIECNIYYKDKEDVIKTFEERCRNAKD